MASKGLPAVKAIYAPKLWVKPGEGYSKQFNLPYQLAEATVVAFACGFAWKAYHWSQKKRVAQYYTELSMREALEEERHIKALEAKYKMLEEELRSSA